MKADKLSIRHSLNINGQICRVTVEHNTRSVFAALGSPTLRGTKSARRGLVSDVRQAVRISLSDSVISRNFIRNHPSWPRIAWDEISQAVSRAARAYEPKADRQAQLELAEEAELAKQPPPVPPDLLH